MLVVSGCLMFAVRSLRLSFVVVCLLVAVYGCVLLFLAVVAIRCRSLLLVVCCLLVNVCSLFVVVCWLLFVVVRCL